jgi:hypothetical protein
VLNAAEVKDIIVDTRRMSQKLIIQTIGGDEQIVEIPESSTIMLTNLRTYLALNIMPKIKELAAAKIEKETIDAQDGTDQ